MSEQAPLTPPPDAGEVNRKARFSGALTSAAIILIYAGFFRWVFAAPWMGNSGGVVSMSFICSVPFACGILSVAVGRWWGSDNWVTHAIITPVVVLLMGLAICVVTRIEAMICVIMAAPILIVCATAGGLIAHAVLPRNVPKTRLYVSFAVFLPFLAAWFEGTLAWPSETKSISNTIVIDAPAERIWPEIASVPAIDPEDVPDRWIYLAGFPKPIAATLDHEGVGGVRVATFDRNVSFFEEVTVWDEPERLAFSIHADPDFIPRSAFDQHIIVGGRFYDVLDGMYEIEPLSPGRCRLHLTSNHRLGTRFNAYAAWWSVKVMDQIQGSILEVIRKRCESGED